jgi:hypothetical protein
MAFDPSVPNAAQNPRMFPQQGSIDFTRLKNIVNADHIFNDAVTANDGIHKQVTLINKDKDSVPTFVPENTSLLYSRLEGVDQPTQLYYFNGTTEQQITPDIVTFPKLHAYANFKGTAAGDEGRIRSSFNIKSILWAGAGLYLITLVEPAPVNQYIVQITASDPKIESNFDASLVYGFVHSSESYGNTIYDNQVLIQLRDINGHKRDVNMVNFALIRVS